MVSPDLPHVWQHSKLSDVRVRARPRCSLVVDEDVTKSNKQSLMENYNYNGEKAISAWLIMFNNNKNQG